MKLLLHVCCAPCSIKCIEQLREENIEPTLFWYNPNIHPFIEYRNRKNALIEYAKSMDLKLIIDDNQNSLYKVISAGTESTVSYAGPINKTVKKVSVPSQIVIDGVT